MARPYRSEQHLDLARPRLQVWAALIDTSSYQRWWPSVVSFDDAGMGVSDGSRWHAVVRGPLLYRVAFRLDLREVVAGASVAARISGDVAGMARLHLRDAPSGTGLELLWSITPERRFLRVLDVAARPVARWAHDYVVAACLSRFARAIGGLPSG